MADTETQNAETKPAEQKPAAEENPWGEDFDPARAWKLVQNLRSEVSDLKQKNQSFEAERQERENAGKSEVEKLQEKLSAAEKDASEARRALNLQKVFRKFPELEGFEDLLTGDSEEEITAKAERLAAIGKPKEGEQDGEKDGENGGENAENADLGLPGRPQADLKPGHSDGDSTAPFDPVAIAKAARRN
jgi:hypothetical protein